MADASQVPPPPPTGTIVTDAAIYNTQITLYRNTMAFGGQRNPTDIWSSMQRNDGLAIPYYRELEEKDTDVANAADTLRDSVLTRDNWVQAANETSQAQDVANFIQAQFDGLPDWHSILANLLDAPGYGFALGEMVFDVSAGQASLTDILDCPQELFLFNDRFSVQNGPLQFLTNPQMSSGQIVPEEKFCIFSYRPRGRDRLGRPMFRSIFWSSWFKRNVQRLWLRQAEKGPGTVVVRYEDAADTVTKQNAASIARAIAENTAVAVPQGLELIEELLTGTRTIDVATYEHLYEAMQLDIVRRMLGETLTSFGAEKGKGTQALGAVHSETLDQKSVQLAKALAGVVNRQIVKPLVLWNFGPDAPMPSFMFDTEQEKDLTERLNLDKGLQSMGLTFTEQYLRETYSVPEPDASDIIVSPTAGVSAQPPIPVTPAFAEFLRGAGRERHTRFAHDPATDAGRHQGNADIDQFDELTSQLQQESLSILGTRVKEIAEALKPGVKA